MKYLETIISYLEVVGGVHGIFLAFLLWRLPRLAGLANKILAILSLALSYLLLWGALHDSRLLLKVPDLMGTGPAVALTFGPLLYFYVKAMTHPNFQWRKVYWFHFIPFLAFIITNIPFYLKSKEVKQNLILEHYEITHFSPLSSQVPSFILLIYMIPVLLMLARHSERIKNYYSNVEKIKLTWLHNLTFIFTGTWFIFILFFFISGIHLAGAIISILLAIFIFVIGYQVLRLSFIFSRDSKPPHPTFINVSPENGHFPKPKYEKSGLPENEVDHYKKALVTLMEKEKVYRESNLTLHDLAARLSLSTHHLSQLLNQHLQVNFYDYVNHYRLEEVKRELVNPEKDYLTILAIAFDAGFNSKASFNATFKKYEGCTPSQYKNHTHNKSCPIRSDVMFSPSAFIALICVESNFLIHKGFECKPLE